jgi:hypothetical protein
MESRRRAEGRVKRRRGAERRSEGRVGLREVFRRMRVRMERVRMPVDLETMGSTPS